MQSPQIDERVRLIDDVPELDLFRGAIGVVRSMWCSPHSLFEVEFHFDGQHYATRALLRSEQIRVELVA